MPRILIIEDDPKIIAAVEKIFSLADSYSLESILDPSQGIAAVIRSRPDLVLLDIRMPGGDGRQILKLLKENPETRSIPVIFLTGLSSEGDKVLGLNLGADDYVIKPFGAMELLARIQAVLRRSGLGASEKPKVINVAGLLIDPGSRSVSFKGTSIRLQPKEFEILAMLASHPGHAFSRARLIESTSTYGMEVSSRSLDTHIKNIRRKLGPGAVLIETLPKIGYRLRPS